MSNKAYRDEQAWAQTLVRLAWVRHDAQPAGVVDNAVLAAKRAGATVREIAQAGGWKSTATVHWRLRRALNGAKR